MKNLFILLALFMGTCVFLACRNADSSGADNSSHIKRMDAPSDVDTSHFMYKAAVGGKMEVELGQMAVDIAKSPQVRDFGAMMVRDHTRVNMELESLAYSKKITLPTNYPNKMERRINNMRKLNGKAFEKQYMDMMTKDQVNYLDLFKAASKDKDTQISILANKTLPLLERHRQKANEVHSSLKN
jgi:putative membrane protein